MSDQCKNCTSKGNIDKCLETDCYLHENWIIEALLKKQIEICYQNLHKRFEKDGWVADNGKYYECVLDIDSILDTMKNMEPLIKV